MFSQIGTRWAIAWGEKGVMVTDILSDLVARIKNGYRAGAGSVEVMWSKNSEAVARVLLEEGYVKGVKRNERMLTVELKYEGKEAAITDIARVSKPGARVYRGYKNIDRVWGGLGLNILSTPRGIMTDKNAKKMQVGGEIICRVW